MHVENKRAIATRWIPERVFRKLQFATERLKKISDFDANIVQRSVVGPCRYSMVDETLKRIRSKG